MDADLDQPVCRHSANIHYLQGQPVKLHATLQSNHTWTENACISDPLADPHSEATHPFSHDSIHELKPQVAQRFSRHILFYKAYKANQQLQNWLIKPQREMPHLSAKWKSLYPTCPAHISGVMVRACCPKQPSYAQWNAKLVHTMHKMSNVD